MSNDVQEKFKMSLIFETKSFESGLYIIRHHMLLSMFEVNKKESKSYTQKYTKSI